MSKFDRQAWGRFISLSKPFFVSELRWTACGLLVLLIGFAFTVMWGINVMLSNVGRDFITALSVRDKAGFTKELFNYLGVFAIAIPIVVFYRYTEERLALLWRRWLSLHLIGNYLQNKAYYKLTWYRDIDNPDQRIEADIRTFCATSLSFFLIILNSVITVFAFVHILWSISTWLMLAVFAYAFFGSVTAYLLGRPLINLNFAQLKKDADYRYKLINVRDNAEAVGFYGVEKREVARIRQRLKIALDNLLEIINWNRNLSFFTTGYNYLVTIIPTVIVAPLYLNNQIEFGVVTQANFAFAQALNALSIVVLNFQNISNFAAVISRLGSFYDTLQQIQDDRSSGQHFALEEGDRIRFEQVTIYTPQRSGVLIRDLSFDLPSGSLLITGPSGSGKSSILRVLAQLWSEGSGRITHPPRSQSFYIPQRAYMVLGTLRNQLLYGVQNRAFLERELVAVVKEVQLHGLVQRVGGLDVNLDWPSVLATGEQQRVAFARLLLSRPQFAFLDEATTALDPETERMLYEHLRKSVKAFISIGHRAALGAYHDLILDLNGDGTWTLERRA